MPQELNVGEIRLRIPKLSDASALLSVFIHNKEHLGRFINRASVCENLDEVKQYINQVLEEYEADQTVNYLMEKDGKIIGMIGLAPLNWKH